MRASPDDPEELVELSHQVTGARAWLAIHERGAGPAFGGTRRRTYPDAAAARADACALARAMSEKCALFELPAGGAKLVLFDAGRSLEEAYRWLGREVEARAGAVFTGPDIGTGARELGWLSAETRACVTADDAELFARATALGVLGALRAALADATGSDALAGRDLVVQGLGQVGAVLAERLVRGGARVRACELDEERWAEVGGRLGLERIASGAELETECDALLPCAGGGFLTHAVVARLRARIVCGSANNQAVDGAVVAHHHAHGGLFVPDVLGSAGALLRGVERHVNARETTDAEIEQRIRARVASVLAAAREEGHTPLEVARRLSAAELTRRRARSRPDGNVL
jgi:leucine dehydrogenase